MKATTTFYVLCTKEHNIIPTTLSFCVVVVVQTQRRTDAFAAVDDVADADDAEYCRLQNRKKNTTKATTTTTKSHSSYLSLNMITKPKKKQQKKTEKRTEKPSK